MVTAHATSWSFYTLKVDVHTTRSHCKFLLHPQKCICPLKVQNTHTLMLQLQVYTTCAISKLPLHPLTACFHHTLKIWLPIHSPTTCHLMLLLHLHTTCSHYPLSRPVPNACSNSIFTLRPLNTQYQCTLQILALTTFPTWWSDYTLYMISLLRILVYPLCMAYILPARPSLLTPHTAWYV